MVNGTATVTCPAPMKAASNGAWQGDNPLDFALPLVILQICIVVVLTRSIALVLRPLRQPRVIAETIGGILLGPSALGRSKTFADHVFPKRSLTVLDTLANIGLLFYIFVIGLELDLSSLRRTGKRALSIAAAGFSLPFIIGIGTSFVLHSTVSKGVSTPPFIVFMGVAFSITSIPVLSRILAELKLLTTDIGRMAMSAAAIVVITAWILLALAVALSGTDSALVTLWVLLTTAAFFIGSALFLSPVLVWIARQSPDGEPIRDIYICATLTIVLAAGFITDMIGILALFGAFVVGVLIPKEGPFARALIEKTEDLVSSLFLPLYFVSSGLKTNVAAISSWRSWGLLVFVITNACLGKIAGIVVASLMVKIPVREAFTLGFLMNTKGLTGLIVLNIGKDRKVLNDETFAIMVLMALFTTFITTPIVMSIYKPAKRRLPYKHRTIQRVDNQSELRILACFHNNRNIPGLINLIESSRGTRRHGLIVYAMHLMDLSNRSSAISMVHKARVNSLPFWNQRNSSSSDQNVVAFEDYHQLSSVSIRSMTAISNLSTINDDIVASAEEKRAALILLPFHSLQQLDGSLESSGTAYQHINQRVLHNAPCSVAILIDRGLGGIVQVSSSDVSCTVTVLFFGGPDDREALAFGARLAEHPGIAVTVLRFRLPEESDHRDMDEVAIVEFQTKVTYEEKAVEGKAQIVEAIMSIGRCNLFLVGRAPPVPALIEKTDSPELGPVGSYLVSSEFRITTASVLVIKRHDPQSGRSSGTERDGLTRRGADGLTVKDMIHPL